MFTDQIGRYFAVFIFAPLLLQKGYIHDDILLLILGILLFVWDLYWLLFREPKVSVHFQKRKTIMFINGQAHSDSHSNGCG